MDDGLENVAFCAQVPRSSGGAPNTTPTIYPGRTVELLGPGLFLHIATLLWK